MQIDRWGRLKQSPDFLSLVGSGDRRPGRLVVAVLLYLAVCFALAHAVSAISAPIIEHLKAMDAADVAARVARGEIARSNLRAGIAVDVSLAVLRISWIAAFFAVAMTFDRRPIRTFVTAARGLRWSHLILGAATGGAAVLLDLAVSTQVYGNSHEFDFAGEDVARFGLAMLAAAMVLYLTVGLFEELVFRGWLMQQTAAFTRNLFLIVAIQAVVFAIAHGDFRSDALLGFAAVGGAFAWATLRLGGLELAIGAHAAYDFLIDALPMTFTSQSLAEHERFAAAAASMPDTELWLYAAAVVIATEAVRFSRRLHLRKTSLAAS